MVEYLTVDQLRKNCIRWMGNNFKDYIDPETDELNCTELAVSCAEFMNHPEWIDDENHWIWELAIFFC